MKSAETIAAFLAIRSGIDGVVAQEKVELLRVADEIGVKTFTTRYGQVTVAQSEAGWQVRLNDDEFLAWAAINAPSEVEEHAPPPVTRVRPSYRAKVMKDLIALGSGDVLNKDTGEIVGYAEGIYQSAGEPYITYPSSTLQKAAKAAAAQWVTDTAQALTDGLAERTAIEGTPE